MSTRFSEMDIADQQQDLVNALVGWYRGGKYRTGVAMEFFYDMDAYARRLGQNPAVVLDTLLTSARSLLGPISHRANCQD